MKNILRTLVGFILAVCLYAPLAAGDSPLAFNISRTIHKNTSVLIDVVPSVIQGLFPLNPLSVVVTTASFGLATVNPMNGIITYEPYLDFEGVDSFEFQIFDTTPIVPLSVSAIIYINVVDADKPCPSECTSDCCDDQCFDRVFEGGWSLANFVQESGTWTQVGDHINVVSPNLGSDPVSSFLRYQYQVSQAFEILECRIEIPSPQLPNEPDCAVGLVSHWNGSPNNNNGSSVVWFSFATDGAGAITGSTNFNIDTYFGGSLVSVPFPVQLDKTYKVTLVKVGQETCVYIDNNLVSHSPNSGSVAGNYIGMWAYRAKGNFKNFSSCSYDSKPSIFRAFNPVESAYTSFFNW